MAGGGNSHLVSECEQHASRGSTDASLRVKWMGSIHSVLRCLLSRRGTDCFAWPSKAALRVHWSIACSRWRHCLDPNVSQRLLEGLLWSPRGQWGPDQLPFFPESSVNIGPGPRLLLASDTSSLRLSLNASTSSICLLPQSARPKHFLLEPVAGSHGIKALCILK